MSPRSLIVLPAVLCAAGAGLALVACGGSAPAATKAAAQDNMLKFARCMREHGINVPDPTPGKPLTFSGTNPQTMDAAQNACKRYSVAREISPAEKAAHLEGALKFARCMREHGVQVPDPSTSGEGVQIKMKAGPGTVNPDSPTFQAAQTACQSLLGKDAPKSGLSTHAAGPAGGRGSSGSFGVYSGPSAGG